MKVGDKVIVRKKSMFSHQRELLGVQVVTHVEDDTSGGFSITTNKNRYRPCDLKVVKKAVKSSAKDLFAVEDLVAEHFLHPAPKVKASGVGGSVPVPDQPLTPVQEELKKVFILLDAAVDALGDLVKTLNKE